MQITVWTNFSKRQNSTKRPASSSGTLKDVNLKDNTSVENPAFILASDDFTINYVQAFGNYYFVDDIISVHKGLIELVCSLDALATYKGNISSYYAFVERSFSNFNIDLPDPFVAIKNDEIVSGYYYGSSSYMFSRIGYYAVSVLNDKGSGSGFTCTYLMDSANLRQLAAYCNIDWGGSATDLLNWIQSNYLHTADSVIDCVWIPISLQAVLQGSVTYEELKVGTDQVTGVYGYRATGNIIANDIEIIPIPHYYSDFRKAAPYTIGKLYLPVFGCIDFNPLDFPDDNIYVKFDIDCCTGDLAVYIYNSSDYLIASYMYNVAVTCPVGKVNQNLSGVSGGLLSTIGTVAGAIASSGATSVASGIAATASGINTIADAMSPMTSYRGSKGGRAGAYNGLGIRITTICKKTCDPAYIIPTHGRPLMEQVQISTLSGYIKCAGASVPITGHPKDKQIVDDYLNNGFYYE